MTRTKQLARRSRSRLERQARTAFAADIVSSAVDEVDTNGPPIDERQDESEMDVAEQEVYPRIDEVGGLSNSSLKRRRKREAREALQAGAQQTPSDNDAEGPIVEGPGTENNQNGCLSASQIKRRRKRERRMAREAEKKRKLSPTRKPEDEIDDGLEPGNNNRAVATKQLKKTKGFEGMFQKAEVISQTAAILEVSSELELKSGLSDCNDDAIEEASLF